MSRLFTRRGIVLAAGGAATVSPVVLHPSLASAAQPSGPLITLLTPLRIYDSRTDTVLLGSAKLAAGGQSPSQCRFRTRPILIRFLNVTITETEGSGSCVVQIRRRTTVGHQYQLVAEWRIGQPRPDIGWLQ
jgi:hypothetical protein